MADVAAVAGVALKTVSRVVNGEPNVAPATQQKVRDAVELLGYRPDLQARSLRYSDRRTRTRTIGLLISSVSNPFGAMLHQGVERVAAPRGVAVFAASLNDDPEVERGMVEAFINRRVDGLILTTVASSQAYLRSEIARGTPAVFVDRAPRGLDGDTIMADNVGGAINGTRHLVTQGHRRIAFLGDLETIETASLRRAGYRQALAEARHDVESALCVMGLRDEAAAHAAVVALLTTPNAPTAIFSSQNLLTIGAVRALQELGMSRKIALVGFDDFDLADLLDPPVTVVAQSPLLSGELAANRVFARLGGNDGPPSAALVPTMLHRRGSGEIPPN
ncbi:LacI family DNA-binding transcriptional regulator [Oerskovia sp. NPDC060338]|uniref:LacI family DNA-binding transcriptional regulator n=1 Tax=Oerskovia sp. NPDC060338 TaxID=3347100 RepID=UPI00365AD8A1